MPWQVRTNAFDVHLVSSTVIWDFLFGSVWLGPLAAGLCSFVHVFLGRDRHAQLVVESG
jgi:hypothetical protein